MSLPKDKRITIAVTSLVVFAAVSILYFNGLLKPTNETTQLAGIESNAGMPTETSATGPALAQFKADCTLDNGTNYKGIVSVPSLQTPKDLKAVELKTEGGDMVRFAQDDANCTYSPY